MRFALLKEHIQFFEEKGFLELEGLVKEKDVSQVRQDLENVLAERLSFSTSRLDESSLQKRIMQGRDVWRERESLQKFVGKRGFAELASSLMNCGVVRLAYDQAFFLGGHGSFKSSMDRTALPLFLQSSLTLKQVSGFQGRMLGLLLSFSGQPLEVSSQEEGFVPFPSKAGNGVFFHETTPLSFPTLEECRDQNFLLIVYIEGNAFYAFNEKDPHLHVLKKFGYVFGDRLKEEFHPTLLRKNY